LRLFSDPNDIRHFIDKFIAWYYHFDDENWFESEKDPNDGFVDGEQ